MSRYAFITIIIIVSVFETTTLVFGQSANKDISIKETSGFCYGVYSYGGKEYPVCYERPTLEKNAFHFMDENRGCFIVNARRYSPSGMDSRVLAFDTRFNKVREIDSCYYNNCKEYIATSGDTVYVANHDEGKICAYLLSKDLMPTIISNQKNEMLKKIVALSDIDTWCIYKNHERLAFKKNSEDSITIITEFDTIYIHSGYAEVLAWRDKNHLLYAKISVKGMGDFYYDLYVYDITSKKQHLIFKDLCNIYDYYDGTLLYSISPNKLIMARMKENETYIINQIDLSNQMEWIYSAYMLNKTDIIIGGDANWSDCHFFKYAE